MCEGEAGSEAKNMYFFEETSIQNVWHMRKLVDAQYSRTHTFHFFKYIFYSSHKQISAPLIS